MYEVLTERLEKLLHEYGTLLKVQRHVLPDDISVYVHEREPNSYGEVTIDGYLDVELDDGSITAFCLNIYLDLVKNTVKVWRINPYVQLIAYNDDFRQLSLFPGGYAFEGRMDDTDYMNIILEGVKKSYDKYFEEYIKERK